MRKTLISFAILAAGMFLLPDCIEKQPELSHYPHKGDWEKKEEPSADEDPKDTVITGNTLKVLFIGNSLTVDATEFVPRLLNLAGADNIHLTRCYHGGYTIASYDTNWSKENNCGLRYAGPGYLWWRGDDTLLHSLAEIVSSEEWDIVTIQGHTGNAEVWTWTETEKRHIQSLISKIKAAHPGHEPEIGYLFSTVYAVGSDVLKNNFSNDSGKMYDAVSSVAEKICKECDIDFVIPSGTAIQNLRSSCLNVDNGQDLSRDLIHVDYGIGRYTAGCTTYKAIFEKRLGVKAEDIVFRTDWHCARAGGYATEVTFENAPIALKCAAAAIADPFTVTDMSGESRGAFEESAVPSPAEPFEPASFPLVFPLGCENGVYRSTYDMQASWRSEGVLFFPQQPQAMMEFEWGPRYEGETDPYFLEYLSSQSKYGTPGFKGLWTGDYLEFRIPVKELPGGSTVNLSLPLYGRQQPAFWDIEYFDGGEWKCNRSAKTAGSYSCNCTFVSNLYSTQVSHDMTFTSAITEDYVRIRLKVAAGEYQNDTATGTVVKRDRPYYNDTEKVYYSPVYFFGGSTVEEIRVSLIE